MSIFFMVIISGTKNAEVSVQSENENEFTKHWQRAVDCILAASVTAKFDFR